MITYFQAEKEVDKKITVAFTGILGFRTVTLLIGGFFYNTWGIAIALAGIVVSWIAPAFTGKYTRHHPIIFSHILELLTALIIVMFGKPLSELRITLPEKRSPGRQFLSFSLW